PFRAAPAELIGDLVVVRSTHQSAHTKVFPGTHFNGRDKFLAHGVLAPKTQLTPVITAQTQPGLIVEQTLGILGPACSQINSAFQIEGGTQSIAQILMAANPPQRVRLPTA